jgi:hypothetical protein
MRVPCSRLSNPDPDALLRPEAAVRPASARGWALGCAIFRIPTIVILVLHKCPARTALPKNSTPPWLPHDYFSSL